MLSILVPVHDWSDRALETASLYVALCEPSGHPFEVVIVDDGSGHAQKAALARAAPPIRIIETPSNLGRGGAINEGARHARGDYLLIVDCDCPPADDGFLDAHFSALIQCDVSIGRLAARSNNFWGRYQDLAVVRRERQFAAGLDYAFTSQNVMLSKAWFECVHGFDPAFSRYGFEDRDFFRRLAAAGARIAYTYDAAVIHDDPRINLGSIARKMREAGASTAPVFRKLHPQAYRELGYATLDARLRPWLRPVGTTVGAVAIAMAPLLDGVLERIPFPIARPIAKLVAGLAFLNGTCQD